MGIAPICVDHSHRHRRAHVRVLILSPGLARLSLVPYIGTSDRPCSSLCHAVHQQLPRLLALQPQAVADLDRSTKAAQRFLRWVESFEGLLLKDQMDWHRSQCPAFVQMSSLLFYHPAHPQQKCCLDPY